MSRLKLGGGNFRITPSVDYLAPPDDWRAQLVETAGRDDDEPCDRLTRRRRKPRQRTPQQERFAEISRAPIPNHDDE